MKNSSRKSKGNKAQDIALQKFYKNFRKAVREVKLSMDGKIQLKDAQTWLDEL